MKMTGSGTLMGVFMSTNATHTSGQVEPFPKAANDRSLSEQLEQLRNMLHNEFPDAEGISLSFDGQLKAHIDIHKGEQLLFVETRLAGLAGGIFSQIHRGPAPHHPFLHRISVTIAR